ncbi:hypothetical protein WN55_11165 [Dufourea novaeangliae]|uniref:Uncharacterized protein n=2 Tax=Dufourea novaeangliae TaxID=178035 RepID=A0A154PC59_DUFNO|nr:hypothetical protein WN55_11165 [Dufourea novaeangliae]
MLPHLSPEDIKLKIFEYSKMAKSLYENELLNKWSSCGLYKLGDSILPEVLLFIHLFEDHPPPYEADGHDFRAIYEFLYRSCFEQTSYFDLPKKDMNLLCSTLIKIENKVWPYCQKDIWEYLGKVYKRRNIKKVYPGKNTQSL